MQKPQRIIFTHFFSFLVMIGLGGSACGQSKQPLSSNGQVHTPKGNLHVLLIFVRYEDRDLRSGDAAWPDSTYVLPDIAKGDINAFFDKEVATVSQPGHIRNMSDYYYQNSQGAFLLTGEIFPVQVPVKYIPENGSNFFARQGELNIAAIKWIAAHYPNFDWSKFDKRTNSPNFMLDNSQSAPDSILDYVVFMHRDVGATGMGSSGYIPIPNTRYTITTGHTGIRCEAAPEDNWEYFKHEFAHNLYSAPHYLGANGACGDKLYLQRGWGMMAPLCTPFFVANAWERWWMGWLNVQTISKSGTYQLKDLATGHDAIRIQIPGTQDYLWLENHQKVSHWDQKVFFSDPQKYPQSAKGIYAMVVADAGADRNKPSLSPFNNRHVNMIKMLNAEGNFDYAFTGDTVKGEFFACPVWEKTQPNAFAGQNDFQGIRWDMNKDGKVDFNICHGNKDCKSGEMYEVWAEKKAENSSYSMNCNGDGNDAFQVGDELGLSGIIPIVNYPAFDMKTQQQPAFILNGLSIRLKEIDAAGTFTLEISFNDYGLRKNARWCGNLYIPASKPSEYRYFTLEKDVTLQLDLSGTPDRITPHPQTGIPVNPTYLKMEANNAFVVKDKATLEIGKYSTLALGGNAQIIVEKGGRLVVKESANCILQAGTQILVKKGGKMTVEAGGVLRQMEGSYLGIAKGAKVKI